MQLTYERLMRQNCTSRAASFAVSCLVSFAYFACRLCYPRSSLLTAMYGCRHPCVLALERTCMKRWGDAHQWWGSPRPRSRELTRATPLHGDSRRTGVWKPGGLTIRTSHASASRTRSAVWPISARPMRDRETAPNTTICAEWLEATWGRSSVASPSSTSTHSSQVNERAQLSCELGNQVDIVTSGGCQYPVIIAAVDPGRLHGMCGAPRSQRPMLARLPAVRESLRPGPPR